MHPKFCISVRGKKKFNCKMNLFYLQVNELSMFRHLPSVASDVKKTFHTGGLHKVRIQMTKKAKIEFCMKIQTHPRNKGLRIFSSSATSKPACAFVLSNFEAVIRFWPFCWNTRRTRMQDALLIFNSEK